LVVLAVEEQEEQEDGEASAGGGDVGNPSPRRLQLTQVAEWQTIRGPEGHADDATKRMALMVAWERPDGQRAAVSGSGGTVAVMAAAGGAGGGSGGGGDGSSPNPWSEWKAHDLEAWAVAFDPWRPPALYSGSDDASLKLWDLRMKRRSSGSWSGSDAGTPAAATPALLLCDKRTHAAGVTCISPHPTREYILATGSYDEKARLWDARRPRCPLAELDVGGGAWRLQWRPAVEASGDGDRNHNDLVLAACMYNGFAVLRATGLDGGEGWGLEAAERLAEPHESIAYGCDWWRGRGGRAGEAADAIVATASFYDRRLCLWQPRTTTT
jgi:diphthamide biosynthesis protein 7